jgi:hypothetical protein
MNAFGESLLAWSWYLNSKNAPRMRILKLSCLFVFFCTFVFGQTYLQVDPNDLQGGGDTRSTGNNCFRLTTARDWESGTVWYRQAVDLTEPFEMEMNLRLGCMDEEGADGMVFIFLPRKVPTGYKGEGMGFGGLRPSLGIEIDTWQNYHLADPAEDHVALMVNGNVSHYQNLKEPVRIPNVEDCELHVFRINWEPTDELLTIYMDGKQLIAERVDMINDIFRGGNKIYWGISAATGKYNNLQEVCFEQLTFNVPTLGYTVKRRLLDGNIADLQKLTFGRGRTQLNSDQTEELDRLLLFLEENPDKDIEFFANSNESGNDGREEDLTDQRLEQIRAYLEKKGVDPERIHLQSLGRRFRTQTIDGKSVTRTGNWVQVRMFKERV